MNSAMLGFTHKSTISILVFNFLRLNNLQSVFCKSNKKQKQFKIVKTKVS